MNRDDGPNSFQYCPIGIAKSPYQTTAGTPIQPAGLSKGERGVIQIYSDYEGALQSIDGFSHLIVLYHFHKTTKDQLTIKPYMDDTDRGVFATRGPVRPNKIGLSIVRLIERNGCELIIEDIDFLDGTPILDIKPYVPVFDIRTEATLGWLEHVIDQLPFAKDDGRFSKN